MSDLTDEELGSIDVTAGWMSKANPVSALTSEGQVSVGLKIDRMIVEIRRHRASVAADRERVRTVVVDAINEETCIDNDIVDAIATRAADQIATAAAVVISVEDCNRFHSIRSMLYSSDAPDLWRTEIAVLDRLIARGPR